VTGADRAGTVLVPGWYAPWLGPPFASVDEALARRLPAPLLRVAERLGPLRGALLVLAAAGADRVVLPKNAAGTGTFLALEAALGRRRTVLAALLVREPPRARWRRALYGVWFALVERPAVRRAVLAGHVLTEWERNEYARLYGIPTGRLGLIPWARSRAGAELPPFVRDPDAGVVCSGRAECDWETVFRAARRRSWPLTVICGKRDLRRVRALNRDGRAEVLCEVPRSEHDERVRSSAVYVLCLEEGGPSAGHVRLMAVTDCGTPVIATAAPGLEGYVEDGVTAVLVPPGDPERLRAAIDGLLDDPKRRLALREAAAERARAWTYREFFNAMRSLVLEGVPSASVSSSTDS
jgi:hypothetical protein